IAGVILFRQSRRHAGRVLLRQPRRAMAKPGRTRLRWMWRAREHKCGSSHKQQAADKVVQVHCAFSRPEPFGVPGSLTCGDWFSVALARRRPRRRPPVPLLSDQARDFAAFNETYQSFLLPDRRPASTAIGVTALVKIDMLARRTG